MGLRQRRGTGVDRRVIGAAVVAGVLVVGGISGVQYASAGEAPQAAIIQVEGQQFDVAGCADLQIVGGAVQCDGKALEPVEEAGAAEAAQLAEQALEASCDEFAAAQAGAGAAEAGAAAEEQGAAEEGADAAVADAQQALFDACIALAEAKAAGAADEAGAEDGAEEEAGAAEEEAGAAEEEAGAAEEEAGAAEKPAAKRAEKN